ncbi:hypothetical protein OIV83_003469 [Microbotryomycetes sp. JL201]|nr:hypothetical protein OIV83_003469 [Microbotryomycetes sp. JL201]
MLVAALLVMAVSLAQAQSNSSAQVPSTSGSASTSIMPSASASSNNTASVNGTSVSLNATSSGTSTNATSTIPLTTVEATPTQFSNPQITAIAPGVSGTVASGPNDKPGAAQNTQSDSDHASEQPNDDGCESEDESERRRAMLEALQQHQQSFLADALPESMQFIGNRSSKGIGKAKETASKPVWEMSLEDLEDEQEEGDSDDLESQDGHEDDQSVETAAVSPSKRVPEVAVFQDPTRANDTSLPSMFAFDEATAQSIPAGTRRDMREFMSSKVSSKHKTFSVADIANAKRKPKSRTATAASASQPGADAEEEAHLETLDSHLSSLVKPLTQAGGAASSQLPQLLAELPLRTSKPLKGHTPLPKNAPRTMRAGQAAANLKRAQKRDEAAGINSGTSRKHGREALTLKEKRLEDAGGEVKRQRGMKGAVGRMGGGELRLSKKDIEFGMNGGAKKNDGLSFGGHSGSRKGKKGKR